MRTRQLANALRNIEAESIGERAVAWANLWHEPYTEGWWKAMQVEACRPEQRKPL